MAIFLSLFDGLEIQFLASFISRFTFFDDGLRAGWIPAFAGMTSVAKK
jgi:hypothetical protein